MEYLLTDLNRNVKHFCLILIRHGGMAEWSKAAVLKTVEVNASVGSNPTPSANKNCCAIFMLFFLRLRDPNSEIRFDDEALFSNSDQANE